MAAGARLFSLDGPGLTVKDLQQDLERQLPRLHWSRGAGVIGERGEIAYEYRGTSWRWEVAVFAYYLPDGNVGIEARCRYYSGLQMPICPHLAKLMLELARCALRSN